MQPNGQPDGSVVSPESSGQPPWPVAVVGFGRTGLALARAFLDAGVPVLGFDPDTVLADRSRHGGGDMGQLHDATVRAMVDAGFVPATAPDRMVDAAAVFLCVPVPLTPAREPDLSLVADSTRAVASRLRRGQLVVLESPAYPGVPRDVVRPLLEESGLAAGRDFHLAYSPPDWTAGTSRRTGPAPPKVIGAFDAVSLDRARALYAVIATEVVTVSSLEAAEA